MEEKRKEADVVARVDAESIVAQKQDAMRLLQDEDMDPITVDSNQAPTTIDSDILASSGGFTMVAAETQDAYSLEEDTVASG